MDVAIGRPSTDEPTSIAGPTLAVMRISSSGNGRLQPRRLMIAPAADGCKPCWAAVHLYDAFVWRCPGDRRVTARAAAFRSRSCRWMVAAMRFTSKS